jgi:hypothetical protein
MWKHSFTHKTEPTRVYVESVSQKLKPQNHVFVSIFPPGRIFATLGFDQTPLQLQIDIYWSGSESTVFSKRHIRPGPNPDNPGNPEHVRFAVDNTSTGQIEDQTK